MYEKIILKTTTLRGKCYLNCTQNHIEQLDIQVITSPKILLPLKVAYLISIESENDLQKKHQFTKYNTTG